MAAIDFCGKVDMQADARSTSISQELRFWQQRRFHTAAEVGEICTYPLRVKLDEF